MGVPPPRPHRAGDGCRIALPRPARRALTLLPLLRGAVGLAYLVRPGLASRMLGCPPTPAARRVLRVLGARHLVQGAVAAAAPRARVVAGGAAVDVLHALSDGALAVASRRFRRAALRDGALSTAFAVAGVAAARQPVR